MTSEIKSDKKLEKELLYGYKAIFRKAITFLHDFTKIQTTKPSTLLRFYFHNMMY